MDPAIPTQPPLSPTPSQPPATQPITPTPVKSKSPLLMIFIVIILLLALGAAGFFAYQNWQLKQQVSQALPTPTSFISPAPVITTITTPDPTANWKIYSDSKYGYSFKYPSDYLYKDNGPNNVQLSLENNPKALTSGTQPAILDTITFSNSANNSFSINIYPKSSSPQFNTNVNNFYEFSGVCGTQFADKTVLNKISNLNGMDYKEIQQNSADGKVLTDICLLNATNNPIILRSLDNSTSSLITKILSTFTFTSNSVTSTTSNWKTYTDPSSEFSFKYPLNFSPGSGGTVMSPITGTSKLVYAFADNSTMAQNSDKPFDGFTVYKVSDLKASSFTNYLTNELTAIQNSPYGNGKSNTLNKAMISGVDAYKITVSNSIQLFYIPTPDGNMAVVFSQSIYNENSILEIDQILSTFKFTN
jgi:hypothetical protein